MSIVSKPTTKAYSKGWSRVFRKPRAKWGIVIGKPKRAGNHCDLSWVGSWCIIGNGFVRFNTRAEAREDAKARSQTNPYWNYHAKKFDGKP